MAGGQLLTGAVNQQGQTLRSRGPFSVPSGVYPGHCDCIAKLFLVLIPFKVAP